MKSFIYITICLFVLCSASNNSYGQFWKKKTKGSTTTGSPKGDAFSGKTKKGPNVYSSRPPRTKNRSKLYAHSISKKRLKRKNKSVFSSTKRRYKSVTSKSKGSSNQNAKSSSGGRKSGKGRKKEK